jgi:hypothetical protein
MYKRRLASSLLFILIAMAMILQFQNCGGFEANEIFENFSFEEINQIDEQEMHEIDPNLLTKTETQYEPLLFDRYMVHSILSDVFGPSLLSVDSARPYYVASEFGAPCSLYVDHNVYNESTKQWVQVDRMESCTRNSSDFLHANLNSKATVTRQALLAKSCSDLTNNTTTMTYALNKISLGSLPVPTQQNLIKLYRLFYRSHPEPSQTLIDTLKVMFPSENVLIDHWKAALYTVCVSSQWQVN